MVKQDANARKDCLAQHAMWSSVAKRAAADTDVAFEEIACVKSVTEGRCARKR